MLRTLVFVLAILLTSFQTFAVDAQTSQQMLTVQSAIDSDLERLAKAKGELVAITEYRIQTKNQALRDTLKELVSEPDADKALLVPLVEKQLYFISQIIGYFDKDIHALSGHLGTAQDTQILLKISKRELEKDNYFKKQLETLDWAKQLDMDVSAQTQALTTLLLKRADNLDSLVSYTQERLLSAVAAASSAGKDVSAEQTARVVDLKERLSQNSQSLSISIALLDQLGQDTAALKKTLFSISGDITQDVLNFDVASSLVEQWFATAESQAIDHGPSVAFKVFIFLFILFLASLIGKVTKRVVSKAVSNSTLKFSQLLQDFFTSLSGKAVFTIGLLIALSQLGFELGPLLAGFGIAGVIIGFALQDTLSNFASGMMILIYRPYDVGDLINAAGVTGRVSHMSLVSTTIKTLDNQRLIIPNNKIWGDTINNITAEHHRRVDMTFGISYSDNIEHAETILKSIVDEHEKVLHHPEPTVRLHLLGESSVDFIVRPWVKPEDYWEVYWDITRAVKMRFDAEGISIPFPQRDVHIYQTK